MVDKSRGYNLPKALCIRGRTHKIFECEGHCQIIIHQMDLAVHKGFDVSIATQPEEERMQRHRIIETSE
jgi:hypothetical protein